ncbi:hypothetical protein FE257_002798 [Aspergillus nanangensis]|uniref:Uncharacterized protein n=1 Tax=Aspergillus nanangensis TaxID=2582783 RepID=A0AAD4CC88_ASPNN|nr:hypothetical protein FE257_002798 [Aspergillus nanangensis]
MSRKDDSKANDATVTVNIDDFTRTRDSWALSGAAEGCCACWFWRSSSLPPSHASVL